MVLLGILKVYINGIILLHFQEKSIVKFCVLFTVLHTDPVISDAGRNPELSFVLLIRVWGSPSTRVFVHMCALLILVLVGVLFACAYERGQVALETCLVRSLPMILSLDIT